jgi:hypothetical protein
MGFETASRYFVVTIVTFMFFFCSYEYKAEDIEKEAAESNYCNDASDCVVLIGKCPMACYILVNRNDSAKIARKIQEFSSNCTYECPPLDSITCEDHKCLGYFNGEIITK